MKKISTLIIAIVAVFALAGHAKAVPMFYTFVGSVDTVAGALVAYSGLASGEAVTYKLICYFADKVKITRHTGPV